MKLSYIAIPYGSELDTQQSRMNQFWDACAYLIGRGEEIISPMTLQPAVVRNPSIPYDWNYWQHYGRKLLSISDKLIIIMLDGWETSTGVAGELEEAERLGIEVEYLEWPLVK